MIDTPRQPEPLTAKEIERFRAEVMGSPDWMRPFDRRLLAALDAADCNCQCYGCQTTCERQTGGHDTSCPIEGVHEHAFRGPHHFREWDPDSGDDTPPATGEPSE